MNDECRNDCVEPIQFPKRIKNRPGLPHINYRIGAYSDFREALLRKLNQTPVLKNWTYRGSGDPKDSIEDPGIALLEGASILGDILTFYQELYANEAYLRTAQWRESIADLVRLVGYRLSPGVGGKSTFALEVSGDKPVTIPAGFPIQAQLEGIDEPVDFETTEERTTYPSLSQFNLYRPLSIPAITQDTKEFYVFSPDQYLTPLELEAGDRLFIGNPDPPVNPTRLINGEIVIIDKIRELHGQKLFKIKGGLNRTGNISELVGFKLGRSFHHFGHNAPKQDVTISSGGTASAVNVYTNRWLSDFTKFTYTNPQLEIKEFPLDVEVEDLPSGGKLVIQSLQHDAHSPAQRVSFTHIRTIKKITSITMRWGALNGSSTLITLDAVINENPYTSAQLDSIQFHEILSPTLRLRAGMQESTGSGNELYFYGTEAEAQPLRNRTLLFAKPQNDPFMANVISVESLSSDVSGRPMLRRITLDRNVEYADFPNENPPIVVYGNLVEADQGKTEKEAVLGNGDSRQTFQTFKLPKAPLTYHNLPGETPPETPELEIYVNGVKWKRAPSFFNRKPKEQIYIVREDASGDSWVQFGDGKTGARLPSGIKNVIAKYRTGIGAHGVLKENTTVQAVGKLNNLDEIQLPSVVSGGNEPESGEKAKEAAPGKIQSLDRLVSLKDFETEALAIPGVAKVTAAWALVDNVPNVVLTLLMKTGREKEFEEVQAILNNYNRCRGPQRFPITVRQGRRRYVYIDATFGLHPDHREEVVKAEIKKVLGLNGKADNGSGLLSLRQRRFGQREYATRIEGTIQNVEGVVWAKVTGLGFPVNGGFGFLPGEADDPSTLSPPEPRPQPQSTVPCGDTQILSLYTGHLQLNVSKAAPTEVC